MKNNFSIPIIQAAVMLNAYRNRSHTEVHNHMKNTRRHCD